MMASTNDVPATNDWTFWVGWGAAFLGFPLGGLAGQAVTGGVTTALSGALAGAATGAVIGAVQWLVLRRRWSLGARWIALTAGGMAAGLSLSIAALGTNTTDATLPLRGLITGTGIGLAQYLALRPLTSRAPAWIAAVAGGWALGWSITRAVGVDLAPNWSVFGSTGAWAFQLLTGLALAWMSRSRTLS
jgi:hypothetical protein